MVLPSMIRHPFGTGSPRPGISNPASMRALVIANPFVIMSLTEHHPVTFC